MLLPKFDFLEPATLAEACEIMAEYRAKAKVIAGGTDLMVNMKRKLISPERLVSISRIEELKKFDSSSNALKLGSCFTASDIASSELIEKKWGALCAGARALGSPLIRNLRHGRRKPRVGKTRGRHAAFYNGLRGKPCAEEGLRGKSRLHRRFFHG